MSFSKEDRKEVFDFFVNILLKFDKPVYYELLRGHLSSAKPRVREFVRKRCKGVELLKYFQNRKNYFVVDFRNEVSLKKDRCMSLPTRISESSEVYESDYWDNSDSERTDNSRSSSFSSSWTNECVDNYSRNTVFASNVGKDDLEAVAIVHFRDLLGEGKKKITTLDLGSCPRAVQLYIIRYLNMKVSLFFENNPEVFRVENGEVWLVNSPERENEFWEIDDNPEPIKPCKTSDEEEAEDIQNFIECAEFFITLLKKKKSVSLTHLSGSLSKAPSTVSDYLSSNYSSFKDFILETKGLFICSEIGEVSLTKDCFKLLKRGKKLSDFKSDTIFHPSTVQKQEASEIFGSEPVSNRLVESETEVRKSQSDFDKSGSPDSRVSSEDTFYSAEDNVFDDKSGKNLQNSFSEEETKQFSVQSQSVENIEDPKSDDVGNSENLVTDQPDEEVEDSGTTSPPVADKVIVESVIELAFCLQFLALEKIENEYIWRLNYEYDAVKFFVEILKKNFLPSKTADLNSLKGFLGQASEEVRNFMKFLYKGTKITEFFEEYEEFYTRSNFSVISLSSSYETYLEEKKNLHESFLKGEKVYDVHNLFNAHLDAVMIDALDCVSKICSFIQIKSKVKLTRLQSIWPQLSASQKEFINSFNGCEFSNKLETFLSYFTIFYVADGCVEINPQLNVQLLAGSANKFSEQLRSLKEKEELKSVFNFLFNLATELEIEEAELDFDCFKTEVIEILKNSLSQTESVVYSYLPKIVGTKILYSLLSENSKSLIQFLEDSTLFELKNGQVCLKKDCEAAEIDLDENDLDETDIEKKPLDEIDLGKIDNSVENFSDALDSKVNLNIDSVCKESSETEHLSTSFSINDDIKAKENETTGLNSMNCVASSTDESNNEIVHDNITSDKVEDDTSMNELPMLDQANNSNTSEVTSALNDLDIENASFDDLIENMKFNREEINFIEESLEKLIDPDSDKIKASAGFYEERNGAVSVDKATAKLDYDVEMFMQLFDKQSDDEVYDLKLFFQSFKENISELKRKKNSDEMEDISNTEMSEIISCNKENVDKLKAKSSLLANKQNGLQIAISDKSLGKEAKHRTYSTSLTYNEECIENGFVNEVEISNVLSEITTNVKMNTKNNEDLKTDYREDAFLKEASKYKTYLNDGSLKALDKSVDSTKVKNQFPDRNKCSTKEKLSDNNSKSGISSKDQSENSFGHFERKTNDVLNAEHLLYNSSKSDVELSNKNVECDYSTSSKSSSDLSENDQALSESSELKNGKEKKLKNSAIQMKNPLFLQPLQARIILLTLDSCVVETFIEDSKRYVFCLKSTFHCDQHNNCSEGFDSLTVGDEISCFVPPGEDFSSGNICFAIMFCKDSNTDAKQAEIPFVHPSKNAQRKLELEAAIKERSVSPPTHESLNNPNYKVPTSRVCEVKTDLVGERKTFHHGVEKACKEKCVLISQDSQTTFESNEVESQTILSGSVKSSLPVADKTCLVKPGVCSRSAQAVCDSIDSVCQTAVTGNIKPQYRSSSSESQTVLSGQIQKSVSLVDKYCEALPHFDLVNEGTQTIVEFDDAREDQYSDSLAVVTTLPSNYVPYAEDFKDTCDNDCQTISTGPIMIKKYIL